jgi:5-methylcytosine-specific restriction endonuclease McrA
MYVYDARRKNNFWELTLDQFQEITQKSCEYCGRPPSQKSRAYTYNGVDRVDPKLGYMPSNVVPCCWECNHIKGSRLTYDEMITIGKALRKFRNSRPRRKR